MTTKKYRLLIIFEPARDESEYTEFFRDLKVFDPSSARKNLRSIETSMHPNEVLAKLRKHLKDDDFLLISRINQDFTAHTGFTQSEKDHFLSGSFYSTWED